MEKLKKRSNPPLFELSFNAVRQFRPGAAVYIALCLLHLLFMAASTYQIVYPHHMAALINEIPFLLIFIVLAGAYLAFLLFSLLAHGKGVLLNMWGHLLLLFEGCTGLLMELSLKCYTKVITLLKQEAWCCSDIKLQIIVGVTAGIFLISCLVLRVFFYYPFHDVGHYLSMDGGSATMLLFLYKAAVTVTGNVAHRSTRIPVLLICTIAVCLLNYNSCYKNTLSKCFWNSFYAICMWTALLLYLVPSFPWLQHHSYQSAVDTLFASVWMYSAPFILFFTLFLGDYYGWERFFQQHKINNQQLLYDLVSRVTMMLQRIKKSQLKTSDVEYKSFLECLKQHCKSCTFADCCYKQADTSDCDELDERTELKRLQKNVNLCFEAANRMIVRFQNREPDNVQALLFGANFSFEVLRMKQKVMFLYNQYSEGLGMWHAYSLHYLRRKVDLENNVHEQMNQQLQDQMLSEFQHNIEVSASMLSEFWYLLSDPKCNTKKLYDLANIIFPLKIQVDSMWTKIQPIRNIASHGLYAKYLIELFNDKETGLKLLDQAKKIDHEIRNRKEITIGLQRNNVADENGVIFLELDESKSGTMYQVNLAAEKIFGYNKGELLNKKVNDIMPRTYSNIHDRILENYALNNKAVMMNKERLIWGKSKSGYLFPFTILIKPVKNLFSEKTEIFASLRREPWLKEIGVIVLSPDLVITDVSSSMLNIYSSLNARAINKRKINVIEIIPDFLTIKGQCEQSRTASIEVERQLTIDGVVQTEVVMFSIVVEQINITFAGCIGYLVKFSRASTSEDREATTARASEASKFEFALLVQTEGSIQNGKVTPTVVGVSQLNAADTSRLEQHLSSIMTKKMDLQSNFASSFVNYGIEIKQKRLYQNQLRDIHSEADNMELFEHEQNSRTEEIAAGEGIVVKPGELAGLLSKPTSNPSIQAMKLVTLTVLLVSCVIIGIQYYTIVGFRKEIYGEFREVEGLHQLISQILYMKQYVVAGLVASPTTDRIASFVNEINQLDALSKSLQFTLNATLKYSDGSLQNMMVGFALSKLISECNSLTSITTQLQPTDSGVAFVNFNSINDMIAAVDAQEQLSAKGIMGSLEKHLQTTLLFIGSCLPLMLVFILANNLLLSKVLQKKTEVLEVFFEIPRKTCRNLQKDCERFIQRFANSQEQDMDAQSQVDYQQEIQQTMDSEKESKKKKRSIEGQDKTRVNFFVATLVFLVVLSLFPLIACIHFQIERSHIGSYSSILRLMANFEPMLLQTINSINSLLVTPNVPILNSGGTFQQSVEQLRSSLQLLNGNDQQYNTQFYLFRTVMDTTFLGAYDGIMFGSICDDTCNSVLSSGLNLHYSLYINYLEDKLMNFTSYISSNDPAIYARMLSPVTLQTQYTIQSIVKKWMRQLTSLLLESLQRSLQFRQTLMFATMLSLIGVNLLAYLLGWIRFFSSLQAKIVATEYILTFIPLAQINKNSKILSYLKGKMRDRKEQERC